MSVDLVKKELKKEFPAIDKELQIYVEGNYVNKLMFYIHPVFLFDNHEIYIFPRTFFNLLIVLIGILESGADDFENSDDLYEAIGEILHEVSSNKSIDDIK